MTTSKIRGGRSKARKLERKQNALDGLKLQLKKETGATADRKEYLAREIERLTAKITKLNPTALSTPAAV